MKRKEVIVFKLYQDVWVKDVMDREFVTVNINVSLEHMIEKMLRNGAEDIFVVDENNYLLSLFSLQDISEIKKTQKNTKLRVGEFIDKEITYIYENTSLKKAKDLMIENGIGRLPVLRGNALVGVIRNQEIRNHLYLDEDDFYMEINHLLDNIHEALCVVDINNNVILWNKNAEKLYHIPRNKIIGQPLEKFFPNALVTRVLETKEGIDNIHHSPKEGSNIAISAQPIYVQKKFRGVISTERDITEIKTLSKKLQKANETVEFLENAVEKLMSSSFDRIIGKSKKILHCIEKAKQVSKTMVSVLIQGESGTGKEMFAKAIHDYSDREGRFIPVNCSAIPEELFESEFFGYVEGAFTGAKKSGKMGYFELAHNGTLFLDEIGDLPISMQAKLLRVLQEQKIKRVGGEREIDINVRIVSATNQPLREMIGQNLFREDLFFRLNVIDIKLPPLRKRREDIEAFIRFFINEMCVKNNCCVLELPADVLELLVQYDWPGNVRELKNVIEQMVVLSQGDMLDVKNIPSYIRNKDQSKVTVEKTGTLKQMVENFEKTAIENALEYAKGSKTKAAEYLGIPRTTLYYKIDQYALASKS